MKKLFALIFMIITGIVSAETTNPQEADIITSASIVPGKYINEFVP